MVICPLLVGQLAWSLVHNRESRATLHKWPLSLASHNQKPSLLTQMLPFHTFFSGQSSNLILPSPQPPRCPSGSLLDLPSLQGLLEGRRCSWGCLIHRVCEVSKDASVSLTLHQCLPRIHCIFVLRCTFGIRSDLKLAFNMYNLQIFCLAERLISQFLKQIILLCIPNCIHALF